MFLCTFLLRFSLERNVLQIREVAARGVEPLSSKLSAQASTCVAGDLFLRSRRLRRHTPSPERRRRSVSSWREVGCILWRTIGNFPVGQLPGALFAERQDEQFAECQLVLITISGNPDRERVLRNIDPQGAMELVPPAEDGRRSSQSSF